MKKALSQKELADSFIIAGVYGWIINEVAKIVYNWKQYIADSPQSPNIIILFLGLVYIVISCVRRKQQKENEEAEKKIEEEEDENLI